MEHQYDTVSGQHADDLHHGSPAVGGPADSRPSGEACHSTFDRWRCAMPVGHDGPHRAGDTSGRTEWNDRAAGRRLRDLARPAEHAARDARAADRT